MPNVHKIAVLRANNLGDLVFSTPALEALRAAYPPAEIVLLAKEWHRELLTGRPGPVDRVVPLPVSRGVRSEPDAEEDPGELERFFATMRKERFDLALQMHGGGRYSNPFLLRLEARVTAGCKTPDALPLERWTPYVYLQPEVLRWLEVAGLVGAKPVTITPRVAVTDKDIRESLGVVPHSSRPLAVLHSGANDPKRRWPVEKFAVVGRALAAAGLEVLATGMESEKERVATLTGLAEGAVTDINSRLSLSGLTGLLSRCSLVVSNDTGPLHLACAVGVPTVGIYWCLNLVNGDPMTRARNRPVVSWRLQCPTCGADFTAEGARCDCTDSVVADVPVEKVLESAFDLLSLPD